MEWIISEIFEQDKTEKLDEMEEAHKKKAKHAKDAASAAASAAGKVGCSCEGCAAVTNIGHRRLDADIVRFTLKTNALKKKRG